MATACAIIHSKSAFWKRGNRRFNRQRQGAHIAMVKGILADPKVTSAIELFEAWTESQMAYRGQPGLSVGIVHDRSLI